MNILRHLSFIVLTLSLAGCSVLSVMDVIIPEKKQRPIENLISQLEPIELPEPELERSKPTLEFVVSQYKKALDITKDPKTRHQILTRLAGLEMLKSEAQQVEGGGTGPFYREASEFYKELLALELPGINNDELQYQLAKSYAMDGMSDKARSELQTFAQGYQDSAFYTEVQFRRGEDFFSRSKYASAQRAYEAVLEDQASPYYLHAMYMHGWSVFKQGKHKQALPSFVQVMDYLLADGKPLDALGKGPRSLVEDTLRVMSIVFSYNDGANTVVEFYPVAEDKPYVDMIYSHLSAFYLEQNRIRRGIDTLQAYASHYPDSDKAPGFVVEKINVLEKSPYIDEIIPAKEGYVNSYGIYSDYWKVRGDAQRQEISKKLKPYLETLAQYYHALATTENKKRDKSKPKPDKLKLAYVVAASWYEQLLASFPNHEKLDHYTFLQAESYFEGDVWQKAIPLYERVAYNLGPSIYRDTAGYGALLSYDALLGVYRKQANVTGDKKPANELLKEKVASAQRFYANFPQHKEALAVLTQATNELFSLQDYPLAIKLATDVLLAEKPAATTAQKRSVLLVKAHSEFELLEYIQAEATYQHLLPLVKDDKKLYGKILEKIAASIYKQAEELAAVPAEGELTLEQKQFLQEAIGHYLRIEKAVPSSPIRITAHFDAANAYMRLEDWSQASAQLVRFRNLYPKNALTKTIPAKLVFIYETMGAFTLAGEEMLGISQRATVAEDKREALYQAAEFFEKGKSIDQAILTYRRYANTYKTSHFDTLIEAQYKLTKLYGIQGKDKKRRFWLKKQIALDKSLAKARTDRSRTLAAEATLFFAEDDFKRFARVKLSQPLKRSLKKKKKAMEIALKSYKKVMDYGIADYVATANHRVGEIYSLLAQDLMDSDRPKNLDELAMEQYEVLLEEQVFPFEEKAIEILEANAQRAWGGQYDDWVKRSFEQLAKLLPARYAKPELVEAVNNEIY